MANPENTHQKIKFHPLGLAGESGEVAFSSPMSEKEGSFRQHQANADSLLFPCVRLSEFARQRSQSTIDLLKLDIEGFEYDVLDDVLQSGLDVRQICLEFHHFLPGRSRRETSEAIRKILGAGYRIIYKAGTDFTFLKL